VNTPGACVVCGGERLQEHFAVGGEAGAQGLIPTTDRFGTALSDVVRCENCGHMQLATFPDDAELSEAYADAASDDYVGEEAGQRETARRILDRVERHVERGRLADLGCWVGFLLDEARLRGWEVVGVEPSDFAAAYARDVLGLPVIHDGLMEADLGEGAFDAVFLGDVIEHLPDPGEALDRVAALLRPGGVVALALPDAGSRLARTMGKRWWSVIPTHVQYFTRESIARLLSAHSFTPLSVATAPKAFTVGYYLDRIGGYSRPIARGLVGAARATRVIDRMWAPDFRDRMLVIARRA
jgi:SAM-dependent methyltransferase